MDCLPPEMLHKILFEVEGVTVLDVRNVKLACQSLNDKLSGDKYVDDLHRSLLGLKECAAKGWWRAARMALERGDVLDTKGFCLILEHPADQVDSSWRLLVSRCFQHVADDPDVKVCCYNLVFPIVSSGHFDVIQELLRTASPQVAHFATTHAMVKKKGEMTIAMLEVCTKDAFPEKFFIDVCLMAIGRNLVDVARYFLTRMPELIQGKVMQEMGWICGQYGYPDILCDLLQRPDFDPSEAFSYAALYDQDEIRDMILDDHRIDATDPSIALIVAASKKDLARVEAALAHDDVDVFLMGKAALNTARNHTHIPIFRAIVTSRHWPHQPVDVESVAQALRMNPVVVAEYLK